MIVKPLLRPAFRVQVVEGEGVFLLSEHGQFVLNGALYCRLAPLLDGRHNTDEIVHHLAPSVPPAEVYYALHRLEARGYIVEAEGARPSASTSYERIAFWDELGLDVAVAERRLARATVTVAGLGGISAGPFERAFSALGVRLAPDGEFAVVAVDDYLNEGLRQFNAESLSAARPWLLVKPLGTVLWVGPVFYPGQSACWECLAARLRRNRRVESYLRFRTGESSPFSPARGSLSAAVEMVAQLAAIEAIKAICSGFEASSDPRVMTFDLTSFRTEAHHLIREPQCTACHAVSAQQKNRPSPLTLMSQIKQFTLDGGHRAITPEETLARYEHHISPITGTVSSLTSTSANGDSLTRRYVAAHASPLEARSLTDLHQILQEVSAGKGMTDAQARASGLCEALERYSGYFWGNEIRKRASYRQLGSAAIHPGTCMLYSERQYEHREQTNKSCSIYELIPQAFDEDAQIEWTPAWSLTAQEFRYLPTEYCYAHHRDPMQPGGRYCLADSNGNAAGNTLEEAILQGFLELVERDSVALWWYNRAHRPGVSLDSFADAYIRDLRRHYQSLRRELWLLDLTSDLRVPVFAAISQRTASAAPEVVWGFGAHFDPRIAALRALTELNQHLPRASGQSPAWGRKLDPRVRDWYRTASPADHTYLAPSGARPRECADFGASCGDDLRDDVMRCVDVVRQHGMDLLVLDQTRPDVGLPVVKVIVPGLRHFRPRLAPGRLYDVAVRLGWLDEPLTEDALNPLPYVFP